MCEECLVQKSKRKQFKTKKKKAKKTKDKKILVVPVYALPSLILRKKSIVPWKTTRRIPPRGGCQYGYIKSSERSEKKRRTAGSETQHLGQEALVQRAEALLLQDGADGGPGPVVLGHNAGHPRLVLDTALDDVPVGVSTLTG